ncbi:uncharacterized protein LOC143913754 [Arctopsyche grandis]|uniref:uncharacterized protein LOC143913754 n=1 Tax=Arctopsyche grandis TaxID=121162 RepID=UPI00406D70CD
MDNITSPNTNTYSANVKIDGLRVCRICTAPDPTISLLADNYLDSLAFRLFSCTSVQVSNDDLISKLLCDECNNRLGDAYSLKKLAQNTNNVLRQQVGLIKIEYDEKNNALNTDCPLNDVYTDVEDPFKKSPGLVTLSKNSKKKDVSSSQSLRPVKIIKSKLTCSKKITKRKKMVKKKITDSFDDKSIFPETPVKNEIVTDDKLEVNSEIMNTRDSSLDDKVKVGNCSKQKIIQKKKAFTKKEKKNYDCKLCSKFFNNNHSFSRHMRVEHKLEGYERAKQHTCDVCGNKFHDRYGLRIHQRSHTGAKPFSCNICGQEFSQQCNMERHVSAKHNKDKIFQCELCPRRYAYSSTLQEHVRNHKGNRDHVCETCGQQFTKRFALTRHQLTHSHVRPYGCRYCTKSYTQSNDLKTHVKKIHVGVPTDKLSNYIR